MDEAATIEVPPSKPDKIQIDRVGETEVVVSWIRGFHGGSDQTFRIELGKGITEWSKKVYVPDGQSISQDRMSTTIDALSPATLYYIRMVSLNELGNSSFTNVIHFTTHARLESERLIQGSSTGAIVGGVVGGLVIIAVVVLVAVITRRYQFQIICHRKHGLPDDSSPSRDAEASTERSMTTPDSLAHYNTVDLSDPSSQYTTLTNKESASNKYDSLHSIELQETRPSTKVYENLKI